MSSVVSLSAYSVPDVLLSRAPVRLKDEPPSYCAVKVAVSSARCVGVARPRRLAAVAWAAASAFCLAATSAITRLSCSLSCSFCSAIVRSCAVTEVTVGAGGAAGSAETAGAATATSATTMPAAAVPSGSLMLLVVHCRPKMWIATARRCPFFP